MNRDASRNVPISLIQEGTEALAEARVHRPQWTAEQLLAERLGCLPVDLYAMAPKLLEADLLLYRADVAARANGVPLQYLLGTADFYGRRFAVSPGVFNPRPETEILVETVLDLLGSDPKKPLRGQTPSGFTVADIGTGSGAIAVTLAKERPGLDLVAVERSWVALHFARRNASAHGCDIHFVHGNLLEGMLPESVDAVVANPPYLNPAQAASWPRELAWEPWLALDGGKEGMELIEMLIGQAATVLKSGGPMILEIGMDQADSVRALAEQNGFHVEQIVKDLANLDRVAVLWKS